MSSTVTGSMLERAASAGWEHRRAYAGGDAYIPSWDELSPQARARWVGDFAAGLRALRVPDEAMLEAMDGVTFEDDVRLTEMWQAAIDSILADESATSPAGGPR